MKINKLWILVVAVVFVLGLMIGLAFHDGSTVVAKSIQSSAGSQVYRSENFAVDQVSQEPQSTLTGLSARSIPVQGRLTNAAGAPINGDTTLTFSLYEVPSGGIEICADKHIVPVTNGLFSTIIEGCPAISIYGQQLYLGITVSGDTEMVPRQAIFPVPYALSLIPGAIINNAWGDRGLEVKSNGIGILGTALWVENTNSAIGGIGLWSVVNGEDASIIASNNGTGPLIKGFGSDGGEDEFRVDNDGAIQTKADTYLFISGNSFQKWNSDDTTRWQLDTSGGANIYRGTNPSDKTIAFPITLPAELYGQPVKIKGITVYYKTTNGTNAFITRTTLWRQSSILGSVNLFGNDEDRINIDPTAYSLYPSTNNILDASHGGLLVTLTLTFTNDIDCVTIGAIRIQLGHHDYY